MAFEFSVGYDVERDANSEGQKADQTPGKREVPGYRPKKVEANHGRECQEEIHGGKNLAHLR